MLYSLVAVNPTPPEPFGDGRPAFAPTVDIHESDDSLVVTVDLPGVLAEDIRVSITGHILEIRGFSRPPEEIAGKLIHREGQFGPFARSFILGDDLASDRISASLIDGVLTLSLPFVRRCSSSPSSN